MSSRFLEGGLAGIENCPGLQRLLDKPGQLEFVIKLEAQLQGIEINPEELRESISRFDSVRPESLPDEKAAETLGSQKAPEESLEQRAIISEPEIIRIKPAVKIERITEVNDSEAELQTASFEVAGSRQRLDQLLVQTNMETTSELHALTDASRIQNELELKVIELASETEKIRTSLAQDSSEFIERTQADPEPALLDQMITPTEKIVADTAPQDSTVEVKTSDNHRVEPLVSWIETYYEAVEAMPAELKPLEEIDSEFAVPTVEFMELPELASELNPASDEPTSEIEDSIIDTTVESPGFTILTEELAVLFDDSEPIKPRVELLPVITTESESEGQAELLPEPITNLFKPYQQKLRELVIDGEELAPELAEAITRLEQVAITSDSIEDRDQLELTEQMVEDIVIILTSLGCEDPKELLIEYAKSHSLPEFFIQLQIELPDLTKLIDYQQHLLQALSQAIARSDRRQNIAQQLLNLLFSADREVVPVAA